MVELSRLQCIVTPAGEGRRRINHNIRYASSSSILYQWQVSSPFTGEDRPTQSFNFFSLHFIHCYLCCSCCHHGFGYCWICFKGLLQFHFLLLVVVMVVGEREVERWWKIKEMACLGGRKICCCHGERLIDFWKVVHSVGGCGGGGGRRWWWREMRKGGYHEYYFFFLFLLISLFFYAHIFFFNFSPIHPLFIIFNIHLFLPYIYFLTFFFISSHSPTFHTFLALSIYL